MNREICFVCIAAIGSLTQAIKAQRILFSADLRAEIVSLSPEDTRRGCAYGVEFSCHDEAEVRKILRNTDILVSQYIRKEQKP